LDEGAEKLSLKSFLIRVVIALAIGSAAGAVVGYVLAVVPEEQFTVLLTVLIIIAAAVLVLFCFYIFSRYFKYSKELKRLTKLLYEDIDVERYIEETKAAIAGTKNKIYKMNFTINLAAGYEAKGDYKKAIELMKDIKIAGANSVYKAFYYNNLAYFYLDVGHLQEALQAYSEGEHYINRFSKNPLFISTFKHTKAVIEYYKGNLQLSEELLEQAKLQGKASNHAATAINLYLAKIYIKTGRLQQAKVLLDYNMSQKLLPNIMEDTQLLMEEITQGY
jgi:tetratricopeptide (TPR) repeat protein